MIYYRAWVLRLRVDNSNNNDLVIIFCEWILKLTNIKIKLTTYFQKNLFVEDIKLTN
jgi:hypothetical protein